MNITNELTDRVVLRELGERLARIRLDRNLTQAELADQAGVSKRTVERMESGEVATQLSGLIRVCRALKLIERFDALIPEPIASPVAQLKLRGKMRKRASRTRTDSEPLGKWTWGDKP
jgi:transcriptional regulator with XRE-family HTH domain